MRSGDIDLNNNAKNRIERILLYVWLASLFSLLKKCRIFSCSLLLRYVMLAISSLFFHVSFKVSIFYLVFDAKPAFPDFL